MQKISSMANHLNTSVGVIPIEPKEDFMVRENVIAFLDRSPLGSPYTLYYIIFLHDMVRALLEGVRHG